MSRKLSPWCKKVKKKLIDLDMTTTELAEVIGLSRGHVSAVVNGRSYSANTVKLISDSDPGDCSAGRCDSSGRISVCESEGTGWHPERGVQAVPAR